jgi:hypothetical protein
MKTSGTQPIAFNRVAPICNQLVHAPTSSQWEKRPLRHMRTCRFPDSSA